MIEATHSRGEKTEIKEDFSRQYLTLLDSYHSISQKIKAIQNRHVVTDDPAVNLRIGELDEERHLI